MDFRRPLLPTEGPARVSATVTIGIPPAVPTLASLAADGVAPGSDGPGPADAMSPGVDISWPWDVDAAGVDVVAGNAVDATGGTTVVDVVSTCEDVTRAVVSIGCNGAWAPSCDAVASSVDIASSVCSISPSIDGVPPGVDAVARVEVPVPPPSAISPSPAIGIPPAVPALASLAADGVAPGSDGPGPADPLSAGVDIAWSWDVDASGVDVVAGSAVDVTGETTVVDVVTVRHNGAIAVVTIGGNGAWAASCDCVPTGVDTIPGACSGISSGIDIVPPVVRVPPVEPVKWR